MARWLSSDTLLCLGLTCLSLGFSLPLHYEGLSPHDLKGPFEL